MLACLRRLLSFSRSMANVYYNLEVSFHHPAWIWLLQPIWWVCAESCLTLCNPLDCNPSSSSVHWISQARILEWVAISSSRGSSDSGIKPASLMSPALVDMLQEGGPLPGPETGLLSNTRKWVVRGDTCADKARDFIGKGHPGGEQEGKGTQENCSAPWLAVLGFMVMELVSRWSLGTQSNSESFLVAQALLSQDGC